MAKQLSVKYTQYKMVIKAEEINQRVLESNSAQIRALEEIIDKAIMAQYTGHSSIINITLPSANSLPYDSGKGYSRIVINSVLDKYNSAGWTGKYNSDQREGEWLSFQIKEGSNL